MRVSVVSGWCFACIVGVGHCATADAAEWSVQPRIAATVDHDTNRRLEVADDPSSALRVNASMEAAYLSPVTRVSIAPRVSIARFDGSDRELDSNDFGGDLRLAHVTPRWSWNVGGNAARDSTLATELTDTGFVVGRARRNTLAFDGSATWQWTERISLQVSAADSDVRFDRAAGTGLVPYEYASASFAVVRQWDTQTDLILQAYAGRLDAPSTGVRNTNTGVLARIGRRVSERLRLEASAGMSQTESQSAHDRSSTYGLNATWQGTRSSVGLALNRTVEPSARGRLVDATSISIDARRELSERFSVFANALAIAREDLLLGFIPDDRDYRNVSIGASWALQETLRVDLALGRSSQSFEFSPLDGAGERVALSLAWSPRRAAMSR
jgi:hypothetical protein